MMKNIFATARNDSYLKYKSNIFKPGFRINALTNAIQNNVDIFYFVFRVGILTYRNNKEPTVTKVCINPTNNKLLKTRDITNLGNIFNFSKVWDDDFYHTYFEDIKRDAEEW